MIDGDCLLAFVAIAEQRSFSRAADRLGIAQSVISKRLLRLEDQLGAALIDRRLKSDIRLTRTGRIFLREAQDTLSQLFRAERLGRNLARGTSGPINIGYIFSAAMSGSLTHLLGKCRSLSPDLQLRPQLMDTPAQLTELESGTLDLGLMRPRPSYPPDCEAITVHQEPVLLCLASTHPLAGQTSVHSRTLGGERFIVPQFHEKVGLIDSLRELSEAGGFPMPALTRTDDFVTAAALAAAREGIVLAPASLTNLKMDGLIFLPLADFDCSLATVLVYRGDLPEIMRTLFENDPAETGAPRQIDLPGEGKSPS